MRIVDLLAIVSVVMIALVALCYMLFVVRGRGKPRYYKLECQACNGERPAYQQKAEPVANAGL